MLRTRRLPSSGGIGNRLKKNSDRLMRMAWQPRMVMACSPDDVPMCKIRLLSVAMNVPITRSWPPGTDIAMPASTTIATATSSRFDTGPASVVRLSSRRIFLKLRVITGVGLAQPTSRPLKKLNPMNGPKMISAGNSSVPMGSTCATGLSVIRPCRSAVWSPSREAVHAWAHSCTLSEKMSRTNSKMAMTNALDCKSGLRGWKFQVSMVRLNRNDRRSREQFADARGLKGYRRLRLRYAGERRTWMRAWVAGLCVIVALATLPAHARAQENGAAKANELYGQGRKVDALPLYEALAKEFPSEMLYAERLADCLNAESMQLTDNAQIKAVRAQTRDAAKRAVELGDTTRFIRELANIEPDEIPYSSLVSPGATLLKEAEKAYGAGDFKTAMEKYTAAADADPKLYEAALYAGDTAFVEKDLPTAAKWFARAIAINPDRETAYRYWGDAILKYGNDPASAKNKFIDAIVAEPYNQLSWQGIENWTARQQGVLMPPKIDRPAGPKVDAKNPKNVNITID